MSKKLSNNVFKKKSGIQNIQEYLESGRSITALESLSNFGIFRLASTIEVLRKRGMSIETEMKEDPNGKTYARYTLVVPVEAEVKTEQAQPKFKVGDRVKFRDDFVDEFVAGKEGEITGIEAASAWPFSVAYAGDGGVPYPVQESELTLIPAETPKKELKVGARVRSLHPMEDGLLGTVTDMEYGLEWCSHAIYHIIVRQDKGVDGLYSADELEVI
jgi:hypothetical protein